MEERCVVKWATPRLHDIELLEQMVDPTIRGTVSPRTLSRFADIVSICLQVHLIYLQTLALNSMIYACNGLGWVEIDPCAEQPEQEYRPSISGLVESLQECARAAEERGEVGRSFRSTNTALCGSTTLSNLSLTEYR